MRAKQPIKIIGERDVVLDISNHLHTERIAKTGRALSSPIRLQMINLLKTKPLSIQEIATQMSLPVSSTAMHIAALEEASLVITESQPGLRGSMRVCISIVQSIHIDSSEAAFDPEHQLVTAEMPIGAYYNWAVEPTCGLAGESGMLDNYDSIKAFYSPKRNLAQLLWFQKGFIEYRFPNHCEGHPTPQEISFTMELCSEAPGYMENWPSDITIGVNGQELGTFRSPGDFGARRGRLTPSAWGNGRTQYGLLKNFAVRTTGGFIDGELANPSIDIAQLQLFAQPYISLKIEIKEDAQYIGGINLFGEKYGDFPQAIVMRIAF